MTRRKRLSLLNAAGSPGVCIVIELGLWYGVPSFPGESACTRASNAGEGNPCQSGEQGGDSLALTARRIEHG